jgi:ABC-2 type transport system ATP-binding protein
VFLSEVIDDHVRRGRNLVLSSHQLDLVEDICETIVLLDHGRVVLRGDLAALKAASPDRYLRVGVTVEPDWLAGGGSTIAEVTAAGTRLRLDPQADAAEVLDRVRAHAAVGDFAVEAPTLSELFLAATARSGPAAAGRQAGADGPPGADRDGVGSGDERDTTVDAGYVR